MNCETCRYSGYGWHENECSRPTTECSYQPIEQLKPETKEVKKELNNSNDCIYCHGDTDGYVAPIEKNGHAFVSFGMGGWHIELRAKGWKGAAAINFCPMCGRRL